MNTIIVILAGGKGSRLISMKPKQFLNVNGKTIIEHTLSKIKKVYKKNQILIVLPKKRLDKNYYVHLKKYTSYDFVDGGISRKESVKNSILFIEKNIGKPINLIIHDAARPNTSVKLIKKIKNEVSKLNVNYVIPYTEISGTLKEKLRNNYKTLRRENYIETQTPQAFKYKAISKYYFNKDKITDDAQLAEIYKVKKGKYILGDKDNIKITNKFDLEQFKLLNLKDISFKVGNGFDVHSLVSGNGIMLGGIKIKSDKRLSGHSDGDVVLHALCDSILGAISKKDIGSHFPSTNDKYKNARSTIFLKKIINLLNTTDYSISNIDITIICQSPSLKSYKAKIKKNILKITNLKTNQLNIKAKTTDYLGLIGKSKAISCWITTTVKK